jgi:glutamate dehydrogenase/leucine dehydrogenase
MELSAALKEERLTHLRLLHDWTRGTFELALARAFDDHLDWSRYSSAFSTDTVPCRAPRVLAGEEARSLLRARGVEPMLFKLEEVMSAGRHEMITVAIERDLGLSCALFVHSSTLGRNNGLHALRAGGFRRHELREPELEVLEDGMDLGRAMSFKNAAADLPLGGCKMTVHADPIALDDHARLGFLSYAIDSGRFVTGPDMGFLPEHADAMRARFTRHVTGGRTGTLGPTGTPTALGCFLAIVEAAAFAFGTRDLRGKRVAIQGVGAVGLPLAVHLKAAGASIVAADVDPRALDRAREELGTLEVVAPEEILSVPCDVLAPCAGGGALDERTIDRLACRMVYGSANNQLKAHSKAEELRLAERLAKRDVLFQIEWTHNTAGVMSGFEEYLRGESATHADLLPRLERVCRDGTKSLLEESRARGATPTAIAYERVERRIFA